MKKDITDDLSDEDREELKRLAAEPDTDDILSEEKFMKTTAGWRSK